MPGPAIGGSCFPKDTLALVKTAQDYGAPMRIVETVVAVNDQRKRAHGAARSIAACGGSVRGKTIAVLGLTFKPNTDDMRDAPSISIITALQDAGARVQRLRSRRHGSGAPRPADDLDLLRTTPMTARQGADALVIVTEWDEFRALDLDRVKSLLTAPIMIDLRNIYDPAEMAKKEFQYSGVGRG